MKRLWVSAAVLPLAYAVGAHADTTISSTSTPVRTSTAAGGQPDNLVIGAGAAVSPAAPGAAVTLDSSNTVTNNGAISFTDVNNATGVLILGGNSGALSNPGTITVTESYARTDSNGDGILDGAFAQGTGRYGVRVIGPGAFTGSIQNTGTITVVAPDPCFADMMQ